MNNKSQFIFVGKVVASGSATLVFAGLLLLSAGAKAQNIPLSDGGSTASINPGAAYGGTGNLGMNNWSVLGQNQLNQQWFWYSINGNTAASIDTIGGFTPTPYAPNDVLLTYANSQISVGIEYVLSGNGVGSGSADLQEYITVLNPSDSGQTINLSFYQYSNFNLLGNNNNTVTISGTPGGYTGATQTTSGGGGSGLAEVIDAPYANYAEAALAGVTPTELAGGPYTLNDNTGPVTGDVSWAFQWNATLTPGEMLDITKDKGLSIIIVPEPSTIALVVLGVAGLGLARRRQSS